MCVRCNLTHEFCFIPVKTVGCYRVPSPSQPVNDRCGITQTRHIITVSGKAALDSPDIQADRADELAYRLRSFTGSVVGRWFGQPSHRVVGRPGHAHTCQSACCGVVQGRVRTFIRYSKQGISKAHLRILARRGGVRAARRPAPSGVP
jgi:hypothetical protein